jgi:hypothetical protein
VNANPAGALQVQKQYLTNDTTFSKQLQGEVPALHGQDEKRDVRNLEEVFRFGDQLSTIAKVTAIQV